MVLRTSLVAVPAFRRVEPVSTSGPVIGLITTSHVSARTLGGVAQVRSTVLAPSVCALPSAARTYGVVPLAAIPAFTSSSAPSALFTSAPYPPAITPTTIVEGTLNVGGHSAASRTPRRPDVPAPT